MVMIEIENIKKFMAGFLGGNLFDDFLMSEGKLSMNIAYEFDGKILKEFYDTEEWEEMKTYPYVMWQEEKEKIKIVPLCRNIGEVIALNGLIFLLKGLWPGFENHWFVTAMIAWFIVAGFDLWYIEKSDRYYKK